MDSENPPPNPESQDEFFSRIRPMLQELAEDLIARDLQSKIDASDLVQQTMLEAYEDLESLKSKDPNHVDSWLRSMLVNNFLDAVRYFRNSLKRDVAREEPLSPSLHNQLTDPPSGSSHRESELKRMHAAMGKLPSAHQQILKWRYFDGFSYRKIAELVSRGEDAVRMMVNRSLDRLNDEISKLHDSSSV